MSSRIIDIPLTTDDLNYLIHHLFLPKELPQINDEAHNISGVPLRLLSDITSRLFNELPGNAMEKAAMSQVSRMMSDWLQLQSQTEITHDSLLAKIRGLDSAGYLPLYVRKQNATILIEKQTQATYVSWFQASATSEDVTTSTSDLVAWFPAGSVVVPHDGILRSEAFAKQLTDLTNCSNADSTAEVTKAGRQFKECREVERTNFVSEWLMALLCAGGSAHDGERVQKKIRDEVLWDQALEPFRRSGFYFSIKVVLQLRLTSLLGEERGKVAYKLLILRALHQVCELWWKRSQGEANDSTITIDLGMQLLAKLAQRLHKLEQLCERAKEKMALNEAVNHTKQAVCHTLQTVRQGLELIRVTTINASRVVPAKLSTFSESQILSNCRQSLKSAKPRITLMLNMLRKDCNSCERERLQSCPRNTIDCQFPNVSYLSSEVATQGASVGVALLDIENWLRKQSLTSSAPLPINLCYNLYKEYLAKASEYYRGDPLGTSRMTLAAVRMIIEMDRFVVAQHSLLLQYKVGIDESLFELLLLKTIDEIKYMNELVSYIRERDFKRKRFQQSEERYSISGSLLNPNPSSKNAFGVLFAAKNADMQDVRNKIWVEAERKRRQKLEEVKRAKQVYFSICQEADKLTHEKDQAGEHNLVSCRKCKKEREAEKITVDVYELPLPLNQEMENAVLFELRIPKEIATLRNALYLFQVSVMRQTNMNQRPSAFFLWRSFGDLKKWCDPLEENERTVTIGSTFKPVSRTHYIQQKIQDWISQPDSAFIADNGMNLVFSTFRAPINFKSEGNLAEYYTFALETPYQVLKWAAQATKHSENDVLCRQVECPPELNVSEFIRFGCLRAGHRVQLHNVVECIEARSLSFKQRSVVSLVLQAVYQVGPLTGDCASATVPESHLMLRNGTFAQAFLDSLFRLLDDVKNNWRDNFTLLTVSLLAARIVNLSPQPVSDKAMKLLLRCREVSTEWEDKVEHFLFAAADKDEKDIQALRLQLASIAATSILTFGAVTTDTIPVWLKSNARLHENLLISGYSTSVLDWNLGNEEKPFYRNLFRQVGTVQLLCERSFHSSVTVQSLKIFIDNHWAIGPQGTISTWVSSKSAFDWWHRLDFVHGNSTASLQVSFDGQFLVNGSPVGKLSSEIQNHKLFSRVFKDTFFDVSPSMTAGETVTKSQSHDYFYAFRLSGGHLLITETCGEKKLLLLPHWIFEHDLPRYFYAQFSHWIDVKTEVIHFRPTSFNDAKFRAHSDVQLSLENGHLVDAGGKKYLLDMNEIVAKELFDKVFKRLELKQHVHVFSNCDGTKVSIDLPRFGLHFERQQSAAQVSCIEFGDIRVAEQQNFDSLVGLEQGIFLTHDDANPNQPDIFLVPHAFAAYDYNESAFSLDLESIREPAYFAFRVDSRLRQLRPPESDAAVFYLAYLHAATSSALPDPFTGLTGSERAMQILGSAACFSCKPYDEETLKTLQAIADLSPSRSYYPEELKLRQTAKFPRFVAATQALDAYRMVVHHLIELTLRTAHAFQQEQQYRKAVELIPKPNDLHIRAFRRAAMQASVLEQPYGSKPWPVQVYFDEFSFDKLDNVRRLVHYWYDSSHVKLQQIVFRKFNQFTRGKLLRAEKTDSDRLKFPCVSEWLKSAPNENASKAFRSECYKLYYFATCKHDSMHDDAEQEAYLIVHLSLYAYKCVSIRKLIPLIMLKCRAEFSQLRLPTHADYVTNTVCAEIRKHIRSLHEYRTSQWQLHGESVTEFNSRTARAYSAAGDVVRTLELRARAIWNDGRITVDEDVLEGIDVVRPTVCNGLSCLLQSWFNPSLFESYRLSILEKFSQLAQQCGAIPELPLVTFEPTPTEWTNKHRSTYDFRTLPEKAVDSGKSATKPDSVNQHHLFLAELVNTQSSITQNVANAKRLPVSEAKSGETLLNALRIDLETSWQKFVGRESRVANLLPDEQLKSQLAAQQAALKEKLKSSWSYITDCLSPFSDCYTHMALELAGLWPRIVPSTVIPCVCSDLNQLAISDSLRSAVLNYAVLSVEEMQMARCLSYCRNASDQSARARLAEELESPPHSNWSPAAYPAWVIFELENDLVIRPMQVEVARKMIEPENGENAVMQLNMGEGKTAVIVPIVLLHLANSEKLARLTVLKSQVKTNYNALKFKLGWLLNRRTYKVPITRDLNCDVRNTASFQRLLEECRDKRGVYLTVPEYRNSLKLKCLEMCRKEGEASQQQAKALIGMWDWLQQYARDILDESDEVLHVKFQLVYTLGQPKTVDGTEMRWQLAEATLNLAAAHLSHLNGQGEEGILFVSRDPAQNCNVNSGFKRFPTIRLLSKQCYEKLCDLICDDVLADKSNFKLRLRNDEIRQIRAVVRRPRAKARYEKCENLTSENRKLIRLLRGLLSHDILAVVLSQRWRVNYGVNKSASSQHKQMAVPFRGKDMPSERTEFGHADVAIMLTVLSYYYGGLSNDQLDAVYKRLQSQNEWERECKEWLSVLDNSRTYDLGNPEEKRKLYDLLRFYPPVIDYYLNWKVFAREAKSFSQKIVTSAWDLAEKAGEDGTVKYPTTGFSGTNETQLLLPCTISQKDLPALQETNGKMLFNLLKPENNHYQMLNANSGGREILDKIMTDRTCENSSSGDGAMAEVRVLLDVGGIVIDLDNKQVAQYWLQQTSPDSVLAALFFDESNELVVLDRRGMQTRASHSPYLTLLDKCVIYLDDAHTRGTDLRFPHGFCGCVTLGKGVTKDRLVQACMRMRKLGNGHSVCFYASHDVHFEITALKAQLAAQNSDRHSQELSSLDVLNWAMHNSGELIKDSFYYWSAMAASYWRRASAYSSFKAGDWSLKMLLEESCESEKSDIQDMYALDRGEMKLPTVAQLQFDNQRSANSIESQSQHLKLLESQVISRCTRYVPNVVSFCELTVEEQERELECEVECDQLEERQIVRPGAVTPCQPHLHEDIRKYILSGKISEHSDAVLPLHKALTGSTLEDAARCWTSDTVFISRDFKQCTDQNENVSNFNDFLRTPRWVAVSNKGKAVVLSQFEANELMPDLRKSDLVSLHLFTAVMRKGQRQLFNVPGILVSQWHVLIDLDSPKCYWSNIFTHLLVFGGSLYFTRDNERRNWRTFLGLCPDRFHPDHKKLFHSSLVDRDGFVPPESRKLLSDKSFSTCCKFTSSPVALVRQLLKLRSYNMVPRRSDAFLDLLDGEELK